MKVFIGGSRRVPRLNDGVRERVDNIIRKHFTILVGDAPGADKAVQKYLDDKQYRNVVVYCSGDSCRNNVGRWETRSVAPPSSRKDFHFYAAKDLAMADDADYGFMLWDAKSRGTLTNVANLVRRGKKVLVYLSAAETFVQIGTDHDLEELLLASKDAASQQANAGVPAGVG